MSEENIRRMWRKLRNLKLHLRSGSTLEAMAEEVNPITRGWINYYGRYYRSKLIDSKLIDALRRINTYLVRWAERKFKKLRGHPGRARRLLAAIAQREPRQLFVHWEYGARPMVG